MCFLSTTFIFWVVSFTILIHDHFFKPKNEKRKIPFLVTKKDQKSYPTFFLWATRMLWVGFICYFWLMTILSSQKLETVKYRIWLQKGVKNHIRHVFLIRDLEIMRGSIYYFWLMIILSSQKLKNVKYRFWLQKGIKNWIL